MTGRERILVALDTQEIDVARKLVAVLRDDVGGFKVGLELFSCAGPDFVRELVDSGTDVFLDLKLHDIPNTVAGASAAAGRLGVRFLTVHALGGSEMIRRAIESSADAAAAAGRRRPLVLAVTILTSHTPQDLDAVGIQGGPPAAVRRLAEVARNAGARGAVCSPLEATAVRAIFPVGTLVVPESAPPARTCARTISRAPRHPSRPWSAARTISSSAVRSRPPRSRSRRARAGGPAGRGWAVIDYICGTCSARHPLSLHRFRCDCGAPLDLDFEAEPVDRGALGRRPLTLWRYREAIPLVDQLAPTTLGEGLTPIIDDVVGSIPARFCLEYVSPTGSYKDRGAALLVAVANALGATDLVDDSSGNAGIALAAHAARAGLRVRVLVPADAPPAKPRLAAELGAEVVRVAGGRAGASAAALREASQGAFYASHAWSPFFLHGAKTLAYSIAETCSWCAPGAVVVPVGNGGLLLGLDLGFRELRRHGLVDRRPALVGVQAANCAPLTEAFDRGDASATPVPERATAADGVRVGSPPRGASVLDAVRKSGGGLYSVSEEEIEAARRDLWRRGYMVESTAALPAALAWREGNGLRAQHGDLVLVFSGSGLKF